MNTTARAKSDFAPDSKHGYEVADLVVERMISENNPLMMPWMVRKVLGDEIFGRPIEYGGVQYTAKEFDGFAAGFLHRLSEKTMGIEHAPRSSYSPEAETFLASLKLKAPGVE